MAFVIVVQAPNVEDTIEAFCNSNEQALHASVASFEWPACFERAINMCCHYIFYMEYENVDVQYSSTHSA